ncbi:hypothetical protein NDU88_007351 [Pleurodeles waltl]|uniref:Uncharacterized protein n=1 Tax=Pleurodeles waltl TaxID=8319 RepID=A0AAV7TZS2_PLEWA|nr:hypothetical protein NDU88_007351 [Pleurodeles waltl]
MFTFGAGRGSPTYVSRAGSQAALRAAQPLGRAQNGRALPSQDQRPPRSPGLHSASVITAFDATPSSAQDDEQLLNRDQWCNVYQHWKVLS